MHPVPRQRSTLLCAHAGEKREHELGVDAAALACGHHSFHQVVGHRLARAARPALGEPYQLGHVPQHLVPPLGVAYRAVGTPISRATRSPSSTMARVPRRAGAGCVSARRLATGSDLSRRSLILSINTLTLRRDKTGVSMILHDRSAADVATAGGVIGVMPAGCSSRPRSGWRTIPPTLTSSTTSCGNIPRNSLAMLNTEGMALAPTTALSH